jgi:hypothetical protein
VLLAFLTFVVLGTVKFASSERSAHSGEVKGEVENPNKAMDEVSRMLSSMG